MTMQSMTIEQMQCVEGGWSWSDFVCGAAIGAAAMTAAALTVSTAGTGVAVGFAAAYSIAVPACGVAALT
jgi:hypothetical protein